MTLPTLLVPKDGIKFNTGSLSEGNTLVPDTFEFKYPRFNKFFFPEPNKKKEHYQGIEELRKRLGTSTSSENFFSQYIKKDTTNTPVAEENQPGFSPLQAGDQEIGELLSRFINSLKRSGYVRVVHYGDSQLEGDRITSYIRNKLQSEFGGGGPGMIPAMDVYNSFTYSHTYSENWTRHVAFTGRLNTAFKGRYGMMGSLARFTPVIEDSTFNDSTKKEAWIKIRPKGGAYWASKQYNQATLFYGNCKGNVELTISSGGQVLKEMVLDSGKVYGEVTLDVGTGAELTYTFKGIRSMDVYGFDFKKKGGVVVDNIALRGSGGTFFAKLNKDLNQKMFSFLKPDLIILQFGGNALPYLDNQKEIDSYVNYLQHQIYHLRNISGGADIMVIGPSDMATKVDGTMQSYPMLEHLINTMKQKCSEAGAPYWDLQAAMGGKNSMLAWVDKDLAISDYTHFTPEGAKFIAELFYEALIQPYNQSVNKP